MYFKKVLSSILMLFVLGAEANEFSNGFKNNSGSSFGHKTMRAAPSRQSPNAVLQTCVCGLVVDQGGVKTNKIINGQEVTPKYKYPWVVLLKRKGFYLCGGSLISTKYVLTAAHCVPDKNATVLQVVMGIYNISKAQMSSPTNLEGELFAITRSISKVKIHGSYGKANDIALLKLSESVTFTDKIRPVCLPEQVSKHTLPPINATVVGWGKTETGKSSEVLREATVRAFSAQVCQTYDYEDEIVNEMICAAAPEKDACQGDSGGPLFHKTNTTYTILGITSFGIGCALERYPGVYTRVSAYTNWIYTKSRGGKYCRNPDNGF